MPLRSISRSAPSGYIRRAKRPHTHIPPLLPRRSLSFSRRAPRACPNCSKTLRHRQTHLKNSPGNIPRRANRCRGQTPLRDDCHRGMPATCSLPLRPSLRSAAISSCQPPCTPGGHLATATPGNASSSFESAAKRASRVSSVWFQWRPEHRALPQTSKSRANRRNCVRPSSNRGRSEEADLPSPTSTYSPP